MVKILRLKKRKDFLRVAKEGKKVVTTTVILQAALSLCTQTTPAQFGLITTKKLGTATIRNKARRRMRAAIRELVQYLKPNTEYSLIGRHNTAECDFKQLKEDLQYAIKKANKLLGKGNTDEKILDSSC